MSMDNDRKHCQICARAIKAKTGLIAHHGYTRPYLGMQTQSCRGARELPYEKSRDVIPKEIAGIKSFVESTKLLLEKVKQGNVDVPSLNRGYLKPTDNLYAVRQGEYISKLEWNIKCANREIERLQGRYDNWQGGNHE